MRDIPHCLVLAAFVGWNHEARPSRTRRLPGASIFPGGGPSLKIQPSLVRLPGGEMRRLELLVGAWSLIEESDDALHPAASGEAAFYSGPGGHSLLFDEVVITPEGSSYAHGILAWRPQMDRYACFVADSRVPDIQVFAGGWSDDLFVLGSIEKPLLVRSYEWSDLTSESFELRIIPPSGPSRSRTYRRKGRAVS